MMYYFLLGLGALALLFGTLPLLLSYRFKRYVHDSLSSSLPEYTPKASLILPCKGIDPGFEENIKAHLEQDYPDYEVIFVTATDDDPAYVFLDDFMKKRSYKVHIKLEVAGISPSRGQKINNVLDAINKVRNETEVFVLVDSDIRPKKDFLRNLIKPLQLPDIGATTGIRWYMPKQGNLGSMLRSIWTAGVYPILIDQKHNFAYGGAYAVKKGTFEKANVRALLDRSISDTFAVTNGVKGIGLKVYFVPQCIVVSHEDSTISETFEWTNRQTIISRVYNPPFWWVVFLTYSFSNLMLLLGIIILILSIAGKGYFVLPALLMLSLIPLEMINAALLLPVVKQLIPEQREQIDKLKWRYYLATPLASILILLNSIVSLTTNEITWRGIRYKLISSKETKVLSSNTASARRF